MRRNEEKIILIISIAVFMLLSFSDFGLAGEDELGPADYSSITQSVLAMQEAFINEDYDTLFRLTPKISQMQRFDNNPVNLKNHLQERPKIREQYINCKLKEVRPITDSMVAVIFEDGGAIYMIKEDGIWKRFGNVIVMLMTVKNEISELSEAIGRFHDANTLFPSELSELLPDYIEELPHDPFTIDSGDYSYHKGEGTDWMIYSVGPDRRDDGGVVEFDISKGIVSQGDIIYTPDRQTTFPLENFKLED